MGIQKRYVTFFFLSTVLNWLLCCKKGLTETELLEILDLPHSVWSPLHIAMDEYIISRSGVLTFFHDYMRQAVEARYPFPPPPLLCLFIVVFFISNQ